MSENDISITAARVFLERVRDRERSDIKKMEGDRKIVAEKSEALIPLRKLLKSLVDAGVYVTHTSIHDPATLIKAPLAPQVFNVWEGPSSPKWLPGGSLFIDHPAQLEIAIPNSNNKSDQGVVVLACSTPHPDLHMLRGPFHSMEEACMALASFLSASTVRIDRPDELKF